MDDKVELKPKIISKEKQQLYKLASENDSFRVHELVAWIDDLINDGNILKASKIFKIAEKMHLTMRRS